MPNEVSGSRLAASREWQWIEDRLQRIEKDLIEEALESETLEDLNYTSGRVHMIREVLALPREMGEPE